MCMCAHEYQHGPRRPEEGVESPKLELELLVCHQCACWELKSGPLKDEQVLLTISPSSVPKHCFKRGPVLVTIMECSQSRGRNSL